ncbi:hypothetical protein FZC35_00090 [Candidatus Cytomitobacter indipagum]|uniref:MFS transporter n=2 Tax=Candidatus Cytomitobacter indipagum TaxID=2601575 RepID=A0A5C0UCQ9_9PROT|nr:hypothetical protein FZC35_00090 [Candidatus Cytomitobacter indipagum]
MQLSYFISKVFFPENFNSMFYLFSAGYAARFFGIFAISFFRHDQEKILKASLLIVSVSSLIISIMPTYQSIGLVSTYVLITLRLLQSISYAVEFPSAVCIASESSSKIGLVISSATVGSILANLSPWILLLFFNSQQILDFYWRIPFMISGALGLILFRSRSVNYEMIERVRKSMSQFNFISHSKGILNSINTLLFPGFLIIAYMCLPQFYTKYGYSDLYFIYKYKLIMLVFSIICVSIIGKLMDSNKNKIFNESGILHVHRYFVILWTAIASLSLMCKFGAILLMAFMQFCIAFSFQYGLKNMRSQCRGSIFASIIAYNTSMFIGSFASSFISFAYMIIIPLSLGSLFAFQINKNFKNTDLKTNQQD